MSLLWSKFPLETYSSHYIQNTAVVQERRQFYHRIYRIMTLTSQVQNLLDLLSYRLITDWVVFHCINILADAGKNGVEFHKNLFTVINVVTFLMSTNQSITCWPSWSDRRSTDRINNWYLVALSHVYLFQIWGHPKNKKGSRMTRLGV